MFLLMKWSWTHRFTIHSPIGLLSYFPLNIFVQGNFGVKSELDFVWSWVVNEMMVERSDAEKRVNRNLKNLIS